MHRFALAIILSASTALAGLTMADHALAQGKPPPLGMDPAPQAGKPAPLPGPGMAAPTPRQGQGGGSAPQVPGKPAPAEPGQGGGTPGLRTASTGTGFVVARAQVLTNHHVADGCTEMRLRTTGGQEMPARVVASDQRRDLALLQVQGDPGPALRFRTGPEMRRGEAVVTYGFPLAGLLSSGPTLTTGEISALAGIRDNPLQFQISAPVQPGNSGGPLLDLNGQVVGVVVAKLDAQRVARSTGDIPQNVNFAVKGSEALAFLRENRVTPTVGNEPAQPRSAAEVGEVAHPSTVFLRCLR